MVRWTLLIGKRWYSTRHEYQKTLLLPRTKFPNRSNAQRMVQEYIPQSSQELYNAQLNEFIGKIHKLESGQERLRLVQNGLFVLHDGPPYANGELHLGHALNKILKDITNRYNLLQGKNVYYKPGWDCHGLPIELKALKQVSNGGPISSIGVRKIAAKHAEMAMEIQKRQFESFNIMADMGKPYVTLGPHYEINQLRVFADMYKKGLIKRQRKPVFWGTETQTALAESELEYNDSHKSISVFVKFPLTLHSQAILTQKLDIVNSVPVNLLAWTTTPWTLVANRALCYNEDLTYAVVKCSNEYLVIEESLVSDAMDTTEESYEVVTKFSGSMLANLTYTNNLVSNENQLPLVHGSHVTNTAGTGIVHTAPGHGSEDYIIGVQHGLEVFSPVNHKGKYILDMLPNHLRSLLLDPETNSPRAVLAESTAKTITGRLRELGVLHKQEEYTHSYPYDWRSKKPVIIRATPQWFADLQDIKQLALKSLEKVNFHPSFGRNRLKSFIQNRNEWCISRQRAWGLPIIAFHKKDDPDTVLMNKETIDHVISVIEKKGIDSWFSQDECNMKEWLPPKYHHLANDYCRGKDTMDVWFDSGTSWNTVKDFYTDVLKLEQLPEPLAQVYLEGSDQHRGWFQSSLLTHVAASGKAQAPFETVITHGFTLDENNIKMSKSIGNTISSAAIIEGDSKRDIPALGVNGLRYFVAQADYTSDIVAGSTVMKHIVEALKKLRLTFKFLLGNLNAGNFELLPYNELRRVDQYIISRLHELLSKSVEHYNKYEFSKVLTMLQRHMGNDISAFYFDISKDSLYCDPVDSLKRQQIQTTLFYILDAYRAIIAPILPALVQEIWTYLPSKWLNGDNSSPFLRKIPELPKDQAIEDSFASNELVLLSEFQRQFNLMGDVITKPAQASVILFVPESFSPQFRKEQVQDILQVASISIQPLSAKAGGSKIILNNVDELKMLVEPSNQHECPRCWKMNSKSESELCPRCKHTI